MNYYVGIDLHSDNSYLAIIDEDEKIVFQKRMPNDLERILEVLANFSENISGLVVESTYNWYWLVDGLKDAGYQVHLANPAAIQVYSGLKYTDDKTDAIWLAKLLKLGILCTGYIYPKESRGLRELCRRRLALVRQQTTTVLSIQGLFTRYENIRMSGAQVKKLAGTKEEDRIFKLKDEHVNISIKCHLSILTCLMNQIQILETGITVELKTNTFYKLLKTIPGVGIILAITILLETGEINRFQSVSNYSSYCRCVESKRISNEKKKGKNNSKNGNVHLSWAFTEAAHFAIRYNKTIQAYYQRKLRKTKRVVALKTVAHKLARAAYFILRDEVKFEIDKAFN